MTFPTSLCCTRCHKHVCITPNIINGHKYHVKFTPKKPLIFHLFYQTLAESLFLLCIAWSRRLTFNMDTTGRKKLSLKNVYLRNALSAVGGEISGLSDQSSDDFWCGWSSSTSNLGVVHCLWLNNCFKQCY